VIATLFCVGVFIVLMVFAWFIRPRYDGEQ
jgi:hypothetical protein